MLALEGVVDEPGGALQVHLGSFAGASLVVGVLKSSFWVHPFAGDRIALTERRGLWLAGNRARSFERSLDEKPVPPRFTY